jgi:hypothetical protein
LFVLAQDSGLIVAEDDLSRFGRVGTLLAAGAKGVRRVEIEQEILDYLYSKSRHAEMARDVWESDVRLAVAIDHRSRNFLRLAPREVVVDGLVDQEAAADVVRRLNRPSGTLALTFHGSFAGLARATFGRLFADGVMIAAEGAHGARDGGFALFAARQALLQGKTVLVSPEGGYGRQTGTIKVLDATRGVADGAPFLAHVTKCNTAWFSMIRTDTGFAPLAVEGPRHADGESFAAFRERFFAFYAEQLENSFTGDPRNLSLGPNWTRTFRAMLAGRADKPQRTRHHRQTVPRD